MTEHVDTPEQETQPDARANILSSLRAARAEIGENAKPLDLPVPGFGGNLYLRLRWVPYEELGEKSKSLSKIQKQTEQNVQAAAALLVETCADVLINVEGDLRPLDEEGGTLTFADGQTLAEYLGFPVQKTARQTCLATFGGNGYALIGMAMKVSAWLEDTSVEVNREFVGE